MKLTEEQLNEIVGKTVEGFANLLRTLSDLEPEPEPEPEPEWPQNGDAYYWITSTGDSIEYQWQGRVYDRRVADIGNCFKTLDEAERHAKRLRSMKPTFVPEKGQSVWIVIPSMTDPHCFHWQPDGNGWDFYHEGRIHPTKEAAEAWLTEYRDVWVNP